MYLFLEINNFYVYFYFQYLIIEKMKIFEEQNMFYEYWLI